MPDAGATGSAGSDVVALAAGERAKVRRVRVKICGITRPQDALAAEQAGADAIGLVFAASSRRVDEGAAREVVAAVGPFVTTVGVFRDQPLEEVIHLVSALDLDVAQLHGGEDAAYVAEVRRHARVMRAFSFAEASTPAAVAGFPSDAYMLDAPRPGSGQSFDWDSATAWRRHARLVVAGGLDPHNVARAVLTLEPYAVDVSTGVEASAGVKDHRLITEFVAAVESARQPPARPAH